MKPVRTLLLSVVFLAAVGAGSAALVDSFGTISGTASVPSAIAIQQVATDNGTVTGATLKNTASTDIELANVTLKISSGDSTGLSGDGTLAVGDTKQVSGLGLDFNDTAEQISVVIDGNIVFSEAIGDLDAN